MLFTFSAGIWAFSSMIVFTWCFQKSMFLYFLDRNNALLIDGKKTIADYTLVALTIMIAESKPEEKEMMINVIMNCMI